MCLRLYKGARGTYLSVSVQPERAGKWEEVSVWGGGTGRRERGGDREEKRGAQG